MTRGVAIGRRTREYTRPEEAFEYAESAAADAGVDYSTGTHGGSGLDRLLLGSVAERTTRASAAPVPAVPSESERAADGGR